MAPSPFRPLPHFKNALRRENLSAALFLMVFASAAVLGVSLFRWQLIHALTVFVEPFIEIIVWILYTVAAAAAILRAFLAKKRSRAYRLLPLLVAAIATPIFIFVPFTALELKLDFWRHYQGRTVAAQRILLDGASSKATALGQPAYLKLKGPEAGLSEDGDVMVVRNEEEKMVFFFTFRGILDHYSGFVYSGTDVPPRDSDFGSSLVEVEHLRKNWFWVASR